MESITYSNKTHGTNMRLTRLAAKEAARVIGQKERPTKRKRHRENETPTSATTASKDQKEDSQTDEEESPPKKISKPSGEGEETSDSEEDMEVKEDEEDEDSDQDQAMTEGEDEEDSGCHVPDGQLKTSSGEPLAVDRDVPRTPVNKYTDGTNCLMSRRSIHLESQGKAVHFQGTTESLPGTGLHNRKNQTGAFSNIEPYRKERVLTKPDPPRHVSDKQCSSQKPTAKGGKQELAVKSNVKTTSYSFFAGWFWKFLLFVLILIVGVILLYLFMGKRMPERVVDKSVGDKFLDLVSSFPSQRAELWKRSKIHLEKHLQTAEPTEPVSMILTSGRGAERTLRCLANRMAAAFSTALGASVLHIDGAGMATLESDQVKLDIDEKLRGAFEGDGRAAVVHRFEELPPGSTLIFYRYCDHENAAYKNVLLVFTVRLPTDELSPELSLNAVEEMVQDHIQDKFLSSSQSASYNQMDMDKLSGLWSRISHLILPVAAEEDIEQRDCKI
ncbi:hypothetical protein SKAU_G00066970 [Synaphobranchus kaupii]|uniref:Torsin-1A-interacting protein 1/2 AAA+ activator domain-containing protein n=1 Tax=Synaphobranchus kaupii TaxID=118154 RepID=A0A9Q1G620_SYNKA|nr:hypothetical protein SKAU_G00066970 [Synaphobranchus kaupii]